MSCWRRAGSRWRYAKVMKKTNDSEAAHLKARKMATNALKKAFKKIRREWEKKIGRYHAAEAKRKWKEGRGSIRIDSGVSTSAPLPGLKPAVEVDGVREDDIDYTAGGRRGV